MKPALRELLQDQPQMEFPDSIDDHLVRLPVRHPPERRIFLRDLRQLHRKLRLIPARLRRDRQPIHRRRKRQRPQMNAVQRVIVMQHIVRMNLLDLRHRPDVPGDDLVRLTMLLALKMKHMPQLDRLLIVPHVNLRLPGAFSLMHPEDRQLADIWVGRHFEHMRQ